MENVFYSIPISRIYDLKGSERSRFNADAAANPQDAGEVHLDDNLRRSNLQVCAQRAGAAGGDHSVCMAAGGHVRGECL